MKASELRIGNCLDYEGTLFCVTDIDAQGVGVKNNEEETWIDLWQMSPIPLTEEWLKKFGFEYSDHLDVFYKDGIDYYINPFGYNRIERLFDIHLSEKNQIKILYVHQLQNLYFALTGKEIVLSGEAVKDFSSRNEK